MLTIETEKNDKYSYLNYAVQISHIRSFRLEQFVHYKSSEEENKNFHRLCKTEIFCTGFYGETLSVLRISVTIRQLEFDYIW